VHYQELLTQKHTTMKKLFYRLSGTDLNLIQLCTNDLQAKYVSLAIALLATTLLAIVSGAEIALQFTHNYVVVTLVALFWGGLVFTFDYILINAGFSKRNFAFRVPVGLANIFISTISLFVLLNQAKIDGILQTHKSDGITQIDSAYSRDKSIRYAALELNITTRNDYHQRVCVPESQRGFASVRYERFHNHCLTEDAANVAERARLDSLEIPLFARYQEARQNTASLSSEDFFQKVAVLPGILGQNKMSLLLAICLFIFLFYVEMQALLLKLSIDEKDEYHKLKAKQLILNEGLSVEKLNQFCRAQKREMIQLEYEQEYCHAISVSNTLKSKLELTIPNDHLILGLKEALNDDYVHSMNTIESYFTYPERTGLKDKKESELSDYESTLLEIFKLDPLIRKTIDQIIIDQENASKAIFDWIVKSIEYYTEHEDKYYLNARETFYAKKGICGEMSILMMAMLRYANIPCTFTDVTVDEAGENVVHACICLTESGIMMDAAYKNPAINHQVYNNIDDESLVNRYNYWNRSRSEDTSRISPFGDQFAFPRGFFTRRKFQPSVANKVWTDSNSQESNADQVITNTVKTTSRVQIPHVYELPLSSVLDNLKKNNSIIDEIRLQVKVKNEFNSSDSSPTDIQNEELKNQDGNPSAEE